MKQSRSQASRWLCLYALITVLLSGCMLPTGVFRSRWAMDDEEYALKYAKGAKKTDLLGKIKQAVDARFMDGSAGTYASGGYARRPDADHGLAGLELGGEGYLSSYTTSRVALVGYANGDDIFGGLDAGFRVQTPSRLAPFVGAGTFLGAANEWVDADDDGEDNNDDGRIDEYGEQEHRFSGALAAIYPETGIHFWWTPSLRLTGFGRYLVSTEGRRADDWLIGAGIAFFTNPAPVNRKKALAAPCDGEALFDFPAEPLPAAPGLEKELQTLSPVAQEMVTGFHTPSSTLPTDVTADLDRGD